MLVSVEGVYQDGQIRLDDTVSVQNDTKVIVTFLNEKRVAQPIPKRLTLDDFSFRKSQEALKDYKSSFSDAAIEERREAL
ncbi:hypothetical protein [Spirosoma rhododendri]|uniref:Uncharacterized protein n=1 Tax=Spirosoma rhododendri TaxID=2728024 RepID=A0A7L5DG74_9BACT|nr:hypothetical protein [Spirosoma rhododendri]QJD77216.1 hypothetical protein HH216_01345 [Spirosoma rhododendri]